MKPNGYSWKPLRTGLFSTFMLGLAGSLGLWAQTPTPSKKPASDLAKDRDATLALLDALEKEMDEAEWRERAEGLRAQADARAAMNVAHAQATGYGSGRGYYVSGAGSYSSGASTLGFTGHEPTDPSGMIYMQNRFYAPQYHRFLTPDRPGADQHLRDTQSWNRYGYVRNMPTMRIDPTGEAVQLTGDEPQRARALDAMRQAVGTAAGRYLYENKVETKDAKGNVTGISYFVGIYTHGSDGKGPAFSSFNKTASAFASVIGDQRVVNLDLVPTGTRVQDARNGATATIGPLSFSPPMTPGTTTAGADGNWHITLVNQSSKGTIPPGYMSNARPGYIDWGTSTAHEFGHLYRTWFPGLVGRFMDPVGDDMSLELENDVRTRRKPNGSVRTDH